MTAPAGRSWLADHPRRRRQRRRLRHALAVVGTVIPDARLAQIAHGAPATPEELVHIEFAETAMRLRRERRRRIAVRARRRCTRAAVVAGAVLLALASVLCLGLGFLALAHHVPV